MFVSSICELTCLSMAIIIICEASITWDIKEEYVIYGRNATLTCNGISCSSKAIRRWIGGPNYNLLCFDDYSTDSSKYEMMSNYTNPEFDLMIKSFNFSDANCEYTCSCGFLQYTKMLKLAHVNFIYLPVVKADSSKQIDDTFQIDLSMEVFPLPTCRYFYEGTVFPANVTVIETPTKKDLELYTVRIQYTLDLNSYSCKAKKNLTCQVRSLEHLIPIKKIDPCQEDEHVAKYPIVISSVACSLIALVAIIAFCQYRFGETKCHKSEIEHRTVLELTGSMTLVSSSEKAEDVPISIEDEETFLDAKHTLA